MKKLLYALLALGISPAAMAQLTGTRTIDPGGSGAGNYATFGAAVAALNTQGVGAGGVTFLVKSGVTFPELVPAITASGTAANPILFRKDGPLANPKLEGTGTGTTDAAVTLDGADYVTFDGIDVNDAAANTTAAQQLEYGFWLKNGATNNTVQNATIDLNRANTTRAYGINVQDGGNNQNRFLSNTVQDCYYGYNLDATTSSSDDGNQIGQLPGGAPSRVLNIGAASGGATGIVYGIYLRSQTNAQVSNTEISTLNGASAVYGIYSTGASNSADILDNRVHGLVGTGSTSAAQAIFVNSGVLHRVGRNRTYDILSSGANGFASGMDINGGTTNYIFNNFVYDVKAPGSTAGTSVRALSFRGGTNNYCYHNTVVLTYTATVPTNKSGAFYISGTPPVDLRNNIFVNLVAGLPAGGGGVAAAFFKSTAVVTNLAPTTGNNLYYAGTPSAENPIFYGVATTPAVDQTLAQYKLRAAPAEQGSVTENVPFVNPATDPHIQPGATTQVEGGGSSLAASPLPVPTDIDGDARTIARPDLGADEGTFTAVDISGPTIAYQPLGNSATTGNRSLSSVAIQDPSGVDVSAATGPRLYYKKSTDANVFTAPNDATGNGWKWVNAGPSAPPGPGYSFTIEVNKLRSAPAIGDTIQYFVAAQDLSTPPNVSASPGAGFAATSVASISSAPTRPNFYKILGLLSGVKTVGTDPTADYPTLTAAVAALNNTELGGALTLRLLDATYPNETYPITINPNPGSSAVNTVTILSFRAGLSATSFTAPATTTTPLLIVDASHVTITGEDAGSSSSRWLSFTNNGTAASSGALFVSGSNVLLSHLNLKAASSATAYGVAFNGTALSRIRRSAISRTATAIQVQGNSTGFVANNNLIGSTVAADKVGASGIVVLATTNFELFNNTIAGVSRASGGATAGIVVGTTSSNGIVAANSISDITQTGTASLDTYGAYGIRLAATGTASNVTVLNNMISGILSNGDDSFTFTPHGIYAASGGGYKLYYNTVWLTGNLPGGATPITAAVALNTGVTGVEMLNNILANEQTTTATAGKTYALYSASAASPFSVIDNNAYSAVGPNSTLAYVNGAARPTLAALRTATGQDQASVATRAYLASNLPGSINPVFNRSCDLNGRARPIPNFPVDFMGSTRNATTPDIGALEFTPTALPAPTAASLVIDLGQPVPPLTATASTGAVGTRVWFGNAALTQRLFAGDSYATGRTTAGVYTYYVVDSVNACVSSATTVTLTIRQPQSTVAALRDLSLSLYPNPASATRPLTLEITGPARVLEVEMLDALGRPVHRQQARHSLGTSRTELVTRNLAPGIYLLRLSTEGQTTSRRVVLE
ncbi:T9SS type A sorting domain-containing protein [Hymenobacter psychrotolerans]|uniref:Por secretion system C-terminal sorting domain-containing protein n=1 Tax=Hymenobacter psychrotolerans DSM 18569 TaxID=1121959 RepID=A0A1M7FSB6_9BACT|nr:T9SS type A sorting domain-containing protein [Hymenobacter psychrotolerans]SHM06923.1 Por secretion system C-terminal sorting domain-containing protein [Hymenobacter psychrotolerans DSM 18569]